MRIGNGDSYLPQRKYCFFKHMTLGYWVTFSDHRKTTWLLPRPWCISHQITHPGQPCSHLLQGLCRATLMAAQRCPGRDAPPCHADSQWGAAIGLPGAPRHRERHKTCQHPAALPPPQHCVAGALLQGWAGAPWPLVVVPLPWGTAASPLPQGQGGSALFSLGASA